jgi:sugar phosphate isomerase/epimerase
MNSHRLSIVTAAWIVTAGTALAAPAPPGRAPTDATSPDAAPPGSLFSRSNLVAWCIVPYDAKKRTPAQRAEMLERIGIRRFAYDWRDQHLPTFETELDELQKHHIELTAVWFPAPLDRNGRFILDTLKKHRLTPQLWVMAQVEPKGPGDDTVATAADLVRPIAREAGAIGCKVALYNHGGWFGEPENEIAIIDRLRREGITNVGMVYNLHHGHEHLGRFPELLAKMKPHLLALNLNGMNPGGDQGREMILPLGQGKLDVQLLKTIRDSGWRGPVGILNHTDEDAEGRLLDNLDGLEWLLPQLDGKPAGAPPALRTYRGR